jgi:pimeloyl-ACP methyl ester carboxylesterase
MASGNVPERWNGARQNKGEADLARKFLYVVAVLIVLTLASALAYRLFGQRLISAVMIPRAAFEQPRPLEPNAYDRQDMWYARPGLTKGNPALWLPQGALPATLGQRRAAVFFIHPTSYFAAFNSAKWNMPLTDKEGSATAANFLKGQSSAFSAAGNVWAPRYRQAHLGAFLTPQPEAKQALDAAYGDVAAAFDTFLRANPIGPIILAGHSQGSLHLLRLLREKVAGTPVASRVAAAYVIGWPVSVSADVPALGLPACTQRGEAGCILSWQSFAEPADPSAIIGVYNAVPGFTGKPRKGTKMLCINPLTGTPDSAAAASQNLGTLVDSAAGTPEKLVPRAVPARCDARGFLLIGDPPAVGAAALPGNNFHVYDYALFWENVRRDATERLSTFLKR